MTDASVPADNTPDYLRHNLAMWDERADAHAASPDYQVGRLIDDPSHLTDVVRFDLPLLGSVEGLRTVHLQCHIGTDTLSLSRLGATVTGLDFSAAALAQARSLAEAAGEDIDYVEGDAYSAPSLLGMHKFDLVFTGIGALCWLPSVSQWAQVVVDLLKPGGRLFIREGHPMLWSLDELRDDALVVDYAYFETEEPIDDDEGGTYVETDVRFDNNLSHTWNHGLGEIVTALLAVGMEITGLVEHDSVPWDALSAGVMVKDEAGEFRLATRPERLACSYTLQAVKR